MQVSVLLLLLLRRRRRRQLTNVYKTHFLVAMRPIKLDVFEDTLFVTLYDQTIVRMNKFTGEHSKLVLAFGRASDVVVVHPLKQVFNGMYILEKTFFSEFVPSSERNSRILFEM